MSFSEFDVNSNKEIKGHFASIVRVALLTGSFLLKEKKRQTSNSIRNFSSRI
jgi:hypothetical protein